MTELVVSGLWRYPVKGMAGNPVAALGFDALGPLEDRRWMVVDVSGHFLSQRNLPVLGQFRAVLLGQKLTLHAPDKSTCSLVPEDCNQTAAVTLWGQSVSALQAPDQANAWLSDHLGQPVRLVRYNAQSPRNMDPDYARGQVSFADGFPLLICHEASLHALNQDAPEVLGMERFRPNVVVSGGKPWAEDHWRWLDNERHRFRLVKPCQRCTVITLKPGTQERNPAVLRHLAEQHAINGKPIFGQNAILTRHDHALLLGEVFNAR